MARPRVPLRERLFAGITVDENSGCWIRAGYRQSGYTYVAEGGAQSRRHPAHRLVYEILVGPIPEDLTIDHLCRNRPCVNPAHLEAVTGVENTMRGESPAARNARKTHCKHGHSLSEARVDARGRRKCRQCAAASVRRWRAAHVEHRRAWERANYAKKRAAA